MAKEQTQPSTRARARSSKAEPKPNVPIVEGHMYRVVFTEAVSISEVVSLAAGREAEISFALAQQLKGKFTALEAIKLDTD